MEPGTSISTFEGAIVVYYETENVILKQQQDMMTGEELNERFDKLLDEWKIWKMEADKNFENEYIDDNTKLKLDILLFTFCDGDEDRLELARYNNDERKYIHRRGSQLKIKHDSYGPHHNRIIVLTKDVDWTLSGVGEIKEPVIRRKKYYCSVCGDDNSNVEIFVHHSLGFMCEDCVANDSDLEGAKWEECDR